MTQKISISLPDDLLNEIKERVGILKKPLSQVMADLLRVGITASEVNQGLLINHEGMLSESVKNEIRDVVLETLKAMRPGKEIVEIVNEEIVPLCADEIPKDFIIRRDTIDPKLWYSQKVATGFLPENMNPNTKKSTISKAIATGKITTNGKTRLECRLWGESLIEWMKLQDLY